jgi:hypothetical protein
MKLDHDSAIKLKKNYFKSELSNHIGFRNTKMNLYLKNINKILAKLLIQIT